MVNDLEYMARKLMEVYRKWCLAMNIGKTKSIFVGDEQEDAKVEDGVFYRNSQQYRYLEVT